MRPVVFRFALLLWLLLLACTSQAQNAIPVSVNGSVSPQVALINTQVFFTLSATVSNPPKATREGQNISGPNVNWNWNLYYRASQSDSYTIATPSTYQVISSGYSGLTLSLSYKFLVAGYWEVIGTANVGYSDNYGNSWAGSGAGIAGPHTAVSVSIYYNSFNITSTTQTFIVGEQVNLNGQALPADAVTSVMWSIPPKNLKDWQGANDKSTAMPIPPADLGSASVAFFWYDGGAKTVTYTVTVAGKNFAVMAFFNVLRPSHMILCDPNVDINTVHIDNNYFAPNGDIAFYLGNDNLNPKKDGIYFHVTLDSQWHLGGYLQWVQTVTTNRTWTQGDPLTVNPGTKYQFAGTGLDSVYPYPTRQQPNGTSDAPGQQLWPNPNAGDVSQADDHFQMWLLYKPLGSNSKWVPLRVLNWHWFAQAKPDFVNANNPYFWLLTSSSAQKDSESDTTDYPSWIDNTKNFKVVVVP